MTITSQQRDTDAGSVPRIAKWVPLAVILTGTFVFILDFFVVNVALPDIQRSLHASAAAIEWLGLRVRPDQRGPPRLRRAPRRPLRPQAVLLPRPGRLRGRVGAVRPRPRRRLPGRGPPRARGRRRHHGPEHHVDPRHDLHRARPGARDQRLRDGHGRRRRRRAADRRRAHRRGHGRPGRGRAWPSARRCWRCSGSTCAGSAGTAGSRCSTRPSSRSAPCGSA
jgi:hypothetical protein